MKLDVNECAVNTLILTICTVIGMISGDITRGIYLEYSKYNIYVEVKKAVNDSRAKKDNKLLAVKKKASKSPPKPSIFSKRLFAILKDPFRNRKKLMIFDERKEKPIPLIYRIFDIKWKGSEKSREIDMEIDRIQALSEIIQEIRESNDKFLDEHETDAVQEYLRKRVTDLKMEHARAK